MSRLYNKHIDQAVRTIDSVQPTTGFKKTEEFKKKLKIKKLEKELGKKPTTQKFNKGGRVGLKLGTNLISRKKSNIQKIQETFGPKKKVPNKFKGFSKLPEKVQQKIDAKLAKKV